MAEWDWVSQEVDSKLRFQMIEVFRKWYEIFWFGMMMVSHINGYLPRKKTGLKTLKIANVSRKIMQTQTFMTLCFLAVEFSGVLRPCPRHGEAPSFARCDSQYFRTQEEGAAHEEFTLLEAQWHMATRNQRTHSDLAAKISQNALEWICSKGRPPQTCVWILQTLVPAHFWTVASGPLDFQVAESEQRHTV